MAFIHYRTQGFVLKKTDRFEADRIFTIFTFDWGRVKVLARAIRKITSKLRSGIDFFYLSEIEFIQGKTYKTLTDAIALEKFKNLKEDLGKFKIAFEISEVLDNFLKFEEKDENIWNLIIETFTLLNRPEVTPRQGGDLTKYTRSSLIYYYFLWNFFSTLGYQPELYQCSLCWKKLKPDNLYFSSKDGGVICQACSKSEKEAKKINSSVIKVLRIIFKKDSQTLSKLKIEPVLEKSLKDISENYYLYLLRENLKFDKIKV